MRTVNRTTKFLEFVGFHNFTHPSVEGTARLFLLLTFPRLSLRHFSTTCNNWRQKYYSISSVAAKIPRCFGFCRIATSEFYLSFPHKRRDRASVSPCTFCSFPPLVALLKNAVQDFAGLLGSTDHRTVTKFVRATEVCLTAPSLTPLLSTQRFNVRLATAALFSLFGWMTL